MKLAANNYVFRYRSPNGASVVLVVRLSAVSAIQLGSTDDGFTDSKAQYVIGEVYPSATGSRAEYLRELSSIRFSFPHAEEFVTDREGLGREVEESLARAVPSGFRLQMAEPAPRNSTPRKSGIGRAGGGKPSNKTRVFSGSAAVRRQ